jgi:molecular chaperone GrpE
MANEQRDEAAREPEAPQAAEVTGEVQAAEGGPGGEGGGDSPQELSLLLEDARAKADEHWEAFLRTKAELENLRKRSSRELENARKFGHESLVQELLPVWDSLELGLSAAAEAGADAGKLREGMELTLKMLATAMEKHGVVQLDPLGERFDPEYHQAMSMQESAEAEPGSVVAVIQKGYTLNGRLVRPALVMVAKAPEGGGAQAAGPAGGGPGTPGAG